MKTSKRVNGAQLPNPLARVKRGRPAGKRADARRLVEAHELEIAWAQRGRNSHRQAIREWTEAMREATSLGSYVTGWQGKVT